MTWLKAEYEFASLFTYRIPNLSPSFAFSSLIPGPSTVKLAMISTAIERNGNVNIGREIFNAVKNSRILFEVPEKISLSKTLIKRLKQEVIAKKMPPKEKISGVCSVCGEQKDVWTLDTVLICKDCASNKLTSTFGTREYVHYSGPLKIFIEISEKKEEAKRILKQIKYFGTSDSLVLCRDVSEGPPKEKICAKPLGKIEELESQRLPIIPLLDFKPDIQFEDINPYEKTGKAPFVTVPYVFPVKHEKEGSNWIIYSRI
ncbi:MAG: hypothetical protein KIH08_10605 [Candidatus Freyarchaeota archaeon]|nr:hypothetical protein [Candidatus Jordarchaeia archaeon]MBS7268228.1 hypothetical protein [Candidatus Jordarchaeia archaeon]MBS7279336.1 hypothetical protein [Candidatus Jordarchaeia archaeon]